MIDQSLLALTKRALEEAGIRPRKVHGQNYVVDPRLIKCLLDSAGISGNETVLEIGSGIGTLTEEISKRAGKVIAVEKDPASARYLADRFAGSNVEIVQADILRIDIPDADKVVSNLPYSISTPVTFKLLSDRGFRFGAFTYQKEVADRLLAEPSDPDYSRLSVAVSLLAEVRPVADFPPESFYPAPSVNSTVVTIKKIECTKAMEWDALDATLKFLFSQRRRTLRKALETYSKSSGIGRDVLEGGIGRDLLEKRVFELTPSDFLEISRAFSRLEVGGSEDKRARYKSL
ncbi:MAG: 16S rRNA (adenine(1518)-N(6)/adenine(1519)-N(6))-dimethyltransferase RsmA [Candidatus Verstraetearchaeota archaeon]|nr:16S rRNA (adenine(1518)-N(6)/adenine(1519)-N(6))-dimethyltransferase RsmA [Candidatus Verstraetearchaeota archaeon]